MCRLRLGSIDQGTWNLTQASLVELYTELYTVESSSPRRRHSSLPRLTVRSAVTSVGYREATVPGAFRLHQFILSGDSLLVSKSGRKTMIMSLRREGMPSPSLSNLMVSPCFKEWLYIFYYYIDVDYMENRRYDERSDYAGGLKAGFWLAREQDDGDMAEGMTGRYISGRRLGGHRER
ncbi:hypothetical protein DY000_02007484 [Brassica cretica]|uniref:Uncharacterized protein n=1 Tax=Brassica cretica TaxID=69181 RepID=A0ABQ7CGR0_BRACR|nr:hypothetical protein DY000_02007484 [Brassica cretica]